MSVLLRNALLMLSLALSGFGCGDNTTTGRTVTLSTALVTDAELDGDFTSDSGWTIRLSSAAVSGAALYYFEGEPAFVLREKNLLEHFAGLFAPSVAHAHPGHYVAGSATGQMTTPFSALLSTKEQSLAKGEGVTGLYRSASFALGAAKAGKGLDKDDVAMAKGVATRGAETVYFEVHASFDDVSRSVSDGQVNGCVFDEVEVTDSGTVTVSIKPSVWFSLMDFSGVEPGTEDAPTQIDSGEVAQLAFALGVVQLSAYHFSFGPN